MSWVNLHCKSTGSFLLCTMTTEKLVEVTKSRGYKSACIMDYGSISLAYEFAQECEKEKIKPILGIEAFVCEQPSHITDTSNAKLDRIGIICKNKDGWKSLVKAVSLSNKNYLERPRLALDEWAAFAKDNWIIITGFPGTQLYSSTDKEGHIDLLKTLFGKENVYIGIQAITEKPKVTKSLRELGEKTATKLVAIADSHYADEEDAADHRVLLCSLLKTTLSQVKSTLHNAESTVIDAQRFFNQDAYYIPSFDELSKKHTKEELDNVLEIDNKCEAYSLKSNPILPKYSKDLDSYEELAERCRTGWKKLLKFDNVETKMVYVERIKHELKIIKEANLSDYFLIVSDICQYARDNGILMGIARGSSGGCLVSYLLGITRLDPIPHKLLFSRFFNESRKNSLPDIDIDFQPSRRQDIFNFLVNKFGEDCVYKIVTFSRFQGRGAIKEVLRVHEAGDYETRNQITKWIPDESKISDDLQEMSEEDKDSAKILSWALINNAEGLSPWVKLEKDGSYSGEYGKYFAQAIRLEGLYRHIGEHASGVIVSPDSLDNYCPIIKAKKGYDAGMQFPDLEGMGLVKIDILSLNALDKLQMILTQMKTGRIYGGDSVEQHQQSNNADEAKESDY